MKKLSVALAVTSALGASAANAAIVSEYANGVLVPWVTYDSADVTTAIGLTSCAAGTVYWSFFNSNSVHIRDGRFDMTQNDMYTIVWSDPTFSGSAGNNNLQGLDGYMTFVLDTAGGATFLDPAGAPDGRVSLADSTCLAGNAFFVDVPNNDVSYIPAFPLNVAWGDFLDINLDGVADTGTGIPAGISSSSLDFMDEDSINGLWAGGRAYDVVHMRYFVDFAAGGRDTDMFLWSVPDVSGSYTVIQYDDDQNFNSIQMFLNNAELNILDLEDPNDFTAPSTFEDGFIQFVFPDFRAPANFFADGFVSWSIVDDPAFQATQTLINPIFKPHRSDGDGLAENFERFNVLERFNPNGDAQGQFDVFNGYSGPWSAPEGIAPVGDPDQGDEYGVGTD